MDSPVVSFLIPVSLALVWVLIGVLLPIRPTRSILRDRVRLALDCVDDRFTGLTVFESLILLDLVLLVQLSLGDQLLIDRMVVFVVSLSIHLLLYFVTARVCRRVFASELNALTATVRHLEDLFSPELNLDDERWDFCNTWLRRSYRGLERTAIDTIAIFFSLATISVYYNVFKTQGS